MKRFNLNEIPANTGLLVGALFILTALGSGCGQASGGVTLKSSAFGGAGGSSAGSGGSDRMLLLADVFAPSSFSFCVTQLKLEGDDGSAVEDEDGNTLLEARLGLIDVGDGASETSWGTASLPLGTPIKRIKVEIHKDEETCGVPYSVNYNGSTISKDVEMTFTLPSSVELSDGDSLTLALNGIATAFDSAYTGGAFTDELIGSYIEDLQGDASND